MKSLLALLLSMLANFPGAGALAAPAGPAIASPAVAFYYGANPPWNELQAFDLVVVDPDHVPDPKLPALPHTRLAAYVAVGEVQPSRPYASAIPKAWLRGENKDWGSRLIDQSRPEWPRFFTDSIITPLWNSGYRTFFLDTLDSYQLFAKTPAERALQEAGMVAVMDAVKQRYPQAKLIFNRGFEILGRTHAQVEAVVAESLFQGYDAGKTRYTTVPEADREWLLGQLQRARDEFHLPVIAIDYVPSAKRELARETARRITALGFIPWVATPDLTTLGVGAIEVMPRRVLVVHSPLRDEYELRLDAPLRFGALPLNHLGYVPDYVDSNHLPAQSLAGRYAGVVVWLTKDTEARERQKLIAWLGRQVEESIPLALIEPPNPLIESSLGKVLGLTVKFPAANTVPVEISQQSALMGFERQPQMTPDNFYSLSIAQGRSLLTLKRGEGQQVAAALMPWGGYVIAPYGVITLPGDSGNRWVIDPFGFLKQALRLPEMPVPDVTTETGRRLFMVHMDGDGFISRSELPGNPIAGEVVRDRVVNKYPVPMTISVIEAELSPQGLYPGLSNMTEKVAKDIFRAPNVAIASHSFSHPFIWRKANTGDVNDGYNLRLPGYRFDLQREIEGSIRYIEDRLAPPGKKVDMFFWTGDCVPGSDALALTRKLGVLNLNGGDTIATRTQPTVTRVEGLGLQREGGFQVFAPNQNENAYTNNWQGPFYGFERVIETFEFTETPRRLKPIDIYFHTYLTTKLAGMKSLDKVFAYAMAQETTPVFVSDYARQVLDFQSMAIARTPSGWRVRGASNLRTLRLPVSMGFPDVQKSQAIAGYRAGPVDSYVHLGNDAAELVLRATESVTPRLLSANAKVESFEATPEGQRWHLVGNVPLKFTLTHAEACRVRAGGHDLTPTRRAANLSYYELKSHVARPLEAICR
ncbi:MAG: hypothetical protein HHJ15_00720 [Rhodoferax sp.]|uniref:bifunctional glycoside hydrolase 114/ polysaccharide deacetylase family protein n=1 Tax=Rhodoferax sp. TaxID=50421 RepID=UPI00184EE9F2|nr:bifunctional glycoside hydrolase 114/ polysaccharide deacetylase family protein [Rhodoferax sp.]NMM18476.1 hypothetical protein [Rhodoferax sp.]